MNLTNKKIKISIVIVNYNTKSYLKDCLSSIEKYRDTRTEIIVVDNGSKDSSARMVEIRFPWVQLISNKENLGFSAANNQAIPRCSGQYIMLLNSDTIVTRDTLNKTIDFMDVHPDAGVVGCKLINPDGSLQPSITSFPNAIKDSIGILLKGSILKNTPEMRELLGKLGRLIHINMSRFEIHDSVKEIDFPRGACMVIRNTVIQDVGLLDENYFFTGEEMDFCYRAKKAGWKVLYYPDVSVVHFDHGSSYQMMGRVFVQIRKSALYFYEKHYSRWHTELMKLAVSSVLLLKCLFNDFSLHLSQNGISKKRAEIEVYQAIIRIHHNPQFRRLNVFKDMFFKYN